MLLPNYQLAIIPIEKLRDYALNSEHPIGKHKAVLFARLLNLSQDDAEEMQDLIFNKIKTTEAIEGELDEYGQRYMVDFGYSRNFRTVTLRTTWIILDKEDAPRLTSFYIL